MTTTKKNPLRAGGWWAEVKHGGDTYIVTMLRGAYTGHVYGRPGFAWRASVQRKDRRSTVWTAKVNKDMSLKAIVAEAFQDQE